MALEIKRQQITRHKHKVSHFCVYFYRKMEFRTYFVFFHTFSYNELPQSLGCLCLYLGSYTLSKTVRNNNVVQYREI